MYSVQKMYSFLLSLRTNIPSPTPEKLRDLYIITLTQIYGFLLRHEDCLRSHCRLFKTFDQRDLPLQDAGHSLLITTIVHIYLFSKLSPPRKKKGMQFVFAHVLEWAHPTNIGWLTIGHMPKQFCQPTCDDLPPVRISLNLPKPPRGIKTKKNSEYPQLINPQLVCWRFSCGILQILWNTSVTGTLILIYLLRCIFLFYLVIYIYIFYMCPGLFSELFVYLFIHLFIYLC